MPKPRLPTRLAGPYQRHMDSLECRLSTILSITGLNQPAAQRYPGLKDIAQSILQLEADLAADGCVEPAEDICDRLIDATQELAVLLRAARSQVGPSRRQLA